MILLSELDAEGEEIRTRRTEESYGTFTPGHSLEKLEKPLSIINEAANNGIVTTDYEDKLRRIVEAIPYLQSYTSSVVKQLEQRITRTELLIERASGRKPDYLKGEGLEFVPSISAAEKVYLNGELVGSFAGAKFGENATNGDMIAWVVSEIIDRDHIKGTQNRDTVYVWKRGWEKPRQIFEDQAYSSEKYFIVYPPAVTTEGNVKIKRLDGDKEIEEEFEIRD